MATIRSSEIWRAFQTTAIPPSPKVEMFFCSWKLKQPVTPMLPDLRPLYSAPTA